MQFSVTFRHMEPTESLKAYARDRMERVRKYLPDPISCHVVLSTERHTHRIDVSFQLHNGLTIAGHETTENMYSSIDLVIAKIERQVRKYKGRLEERRVRPHAIEPLPWSHSIVEDAFAGIDVPAAMAAAAAAPSANGHGANGHAANGHAANGHGANGNGHAPLPPTVHAEGSGAMRIPELKVIRTEKFHAQPMSVSDAIVQLELAGETFLVFRTDTDGRVAVVYRRDDGHYGLIETPAQA